MKQQLQRRLVSRQTVVGRIWYAPWLWWHSVDWSLPCPVLLELTRVDQWDFNVWSLSRLWFMQATGPKAQWALKWWFVETRRGNRLKWTHSSTTAAAGNHRSPWAVETLKPNNSFCISKAQPAGAIKSYQGLQALAPKHLRLLQSLQFRKRLKKKLLTNWTKEMSTCQQLCLVLCL